MSRGLALAGAAVALLASVTSSASSHEPLARAYYACAEQVGHTAAMRLAADQESLMVDGPGEHWRSGRLADSLMATRCLLQRTGAPASVGVRMGNLTPTPQAQSQVWGTLRVSWTYSPANGLDVTFSDHDGH